MEQMDHWDRRFETFELYKQLIRHDVLKAFTPASVKEEQDWVRQAKECLVCGTTEPDCELTWQEGGTEVGPQPEKERLLLFRPRRWICVFNVEVSRPRALCPSCYRLVQFELIDGIWNPFYMEPHELQRILPFKGGIKISSYPEWLPITDDHAESV